MASATRAVEICQRLGDRAREGDNLSVCGIILSEVGRYEEARERFDLALAIHADTGSRWSRADCLVYAGSNEALLGDCERGLALIEEALTTAREIGAKYVEANALVAEAGALLLRGDESQRDIDRALEAATRAAVVAREASLRGPEIQGLSRQAMAIWRAGYLDAALALSTRALRLLDTQHYVEGPEEELLFTHYQLLHAAGSPDADATLARAREGVARKLSLLKNPDWRRSFTHDIALHLAIARGHAPGS